MLPASSQVPGHKRKLALLLMAIAKGVCSITKDFGIDMSLLAVTTPLYDFAMDRVREGYVMFYDFLEGRGGGVCVCVGGGGHVT